jgi:tRNA A22 N-methylase
MVSLERCRTLARKHGYNYTDEQLLKIRDFLYQLAAIEYKVYQRKMNENEKSNHLHESIIGRAG